MSKRQDCILCWYRDGKLVSESSPMTSGAAQLEAVGRARAIAGDVEATIYRGGAALRGWHMVGAHELRARARALVAQ